MTERVLDISEGAAKVSVRNRLLVVARPEAAEVTMPLEEAVVVVCSHPQIVFTQAALAEVALKGGMVVVCGSNHHPAGMLLPVSGHHLQAERFIQQAEAPKPVCKRVWRQVVRAKILHQARVLERVQGHDGRGDRPEAVEISPRRARSTRSGENEGRILRDLRALRGEELDGLAELGLRAMAERVRSGDPENVEAQAARKYWPLLFGPAFLRDREAAGVNPMLNYGYAILRAMTARAVCAAGLHPTLGLHHHNKYNAFCLADDLMEPFRPLVDRTVAEFLAFYGPDPAMDKTAKQGLIEGLTGRVRVGGEWRTVFDALTRMAASLAGVYAGERKEILLPEIWWEEPTSRGDAESRRG
jgi:CRISPR-associated protein Cas1